MVHIVAADDDAMHLEILVKNLGDAGYPVLGFDDGEGLWEYIQAHPGQVDVAILDKMMPRMDGMEVVSKLQSHPELKDVVVIMQTADARIGRVGEALEQGIHFYLTKPFRPEQIQTLLKAAIRIRQKGSGGGSNDDGAGSRSFVDRVMY